MAPSLSSKVSFSNWVLGGPLVTVSKTEDPQPRQRRAHRVVITELDSDGNEIEKHIVPLTKHKKRTTKKSDTKHDSDSDREKNKESVAPTLKPVDGPFCSHCGSKRDECPGKDCHLIGNQGNDEMKNDPKTSTAAIEGSQYDNIPWTALQDRMIQEMKGQNKSWKEIAAAVGGTKKEVHHRFKTLQAINQTGGMTTGGEAAAPKGLGLSEVDTTGFDFSNLFMDDDSGVDGGVSGNDAPFSTLTDYDGYRSDKKKSKKDDKKKKDFDIEDTGSDWYEISPHGSYSAPHYTSHSKATAPHLRPDAAWSAHDCHLLEELETTYRNNKWLQLQADFFNWSGRMVDASIIERKFKDDGLV